MGCRDQSNKQEKSMKVQNMPENDFWTEIQILDDHNAY